MTKVNKIQTQSNKIFTNIPKNEVPSMNELIKKYFMKLKFRTEREVPEYGDFANVFERFANPDKSLCASDFVLRIVKPPKTVVNHEKIRNLELVAYKLPAPYKATIVLETGTKEELLNKLNDENIYKKIEESLRSLSKDLEDI